MPQAQFLNRSFLFTPEDLILMGVVSCVTYLPCCVILGILTGNFNSLAATAERIVIEMLSKLEPFPNEAYQDRVNDQVQSFVDTNRQIILLGFLLTMMFGANFIINAAMSFACCRGKCPSS